MPTYLVLLLAYVFSQFYRSFLAVVASDLGRDLGLDAAELGRLSAVWFAGFAAAQLPIGYALDRFGPRRTLTSVMLVAAVGAGWLSVAEGQAGALVAMGLIGVGCAPVLMAGMYLFARLYSSGRFAMLSSSLIGIGSVGNLIGTWPLVWLVERSGWRWAILLVAGLTALVVGVVWAVVRDPPSLAGAPGEGSMLGGLRSIMRIRALWLLLPLTATSYAVVIATRSLWIAPFLAEVHGFDKAEIGWAALAMAAAMSAGALAYGPAERMIGAKRATAAGTVLTAASFAVLAIWGAADARLAVASMTLIGAAGLTYAILMAHGRTFMPAALIGRGVTFLNLAFIGGAGIAQWLSGWFVQASIEAGATPNTVYPQLFLAFAALLFVSLLVYLAAPARPAGQAGGPSA